MSPFNLETDTPFDSYSARQTGEPMNLQKPCSQYMHFSGERLSGAAREYICFVYTFTFEAAHSCRLASNPLKKLLREILGTRPLFR